MMVSAWGLRQLHSLQQSVGVL